MTAEQREAIPQDQAEQTLKIAEGLLKLVRGKTSQTFYSIGTSDIENVCKAYLTLSTQLARLREALNSAAKELGNNSSNFESSKDHYYQNASVKITTAQQIISTALSHPRSEATNSHTGFWSTHKELWLCDKGCAACEVEDEKSLSNNDEEEGQ